MSHTGLHVALQLRRSLYAWITYLDVGVLLPMLLESLEDPTVVGNSVTLWLKVGFPTLVESEVSMVLVLVCGKFPNGELGDGVDEELVESTDCPGLVGDEAGPVGDGAGRDETEVLGPEDTRVAVAVEAGGLPGEFVGFDIVGPSVEDGVGRDTVNWVLPTVDSVPIEPELGWVEG